MRVFRRPGEFRTPDEGAFRPGRVRRDTGDGAAEESTGFEDRTPSVGFKDVAGLDGVIEDLRDVVGYVAAPDAYDRLGARPPTGILLHGEPGCGKTLLGRALAGEVGVPFYFVSATAFVERFVGLGASRIRELFTTAAQDAPCIVFIDELDAVGRQRTDAAGDREFDHTLNQLLVELDGFLGARGVITIGATNRPELLDAALVRPGRFDRRIEISRPDREGRAAVLRLHGERRPCEPGVDWTKVAEATDGCSSAELAGLVNEAALLAARKGADSIVWADVEQALDRLAGGGLRSVTRTDAELRRRAVHEAGHALVALARPGAVPCVRTSILSCGAGPAAPVAWSASSRRPVSSGPELVSEMVVLMAGRAAELAVLGSASTLSEADHTRATQIAELVVSAGLGPEGTPATAAGLLQWADLEARTLVCREPTLLEEIADALRAAGGAMFIDEVHALVGTRPAD
ncbi:MAG TPA: AAA family ATPase [Pseudonocardia sp.]|jgi:cell division protease FtsH|nr:AAA family ATPase [Pseudonocardia sp.]